MSLRPRSLFRRNIQAKSYGGGMLANRFFFPLFSPDGVAVFPYEKDGITKSCWRWSKRKVEEENERIEWVKGRKGWTPYFRIYADTRKATPLSTLWQNAEVGSNRTSKHEINSLFPGNEFATPNLNISPKKRPWA